MSAERRAKVLAYVTDKGSATAAALCGDLGIAPATVYRDLAALADEGLIKRVRGGALAVEPDERPISLESQLNLEAKRAIGAAAAKLVRPGSTIFLDASTTVQSMVPLVRRIPGLTVVTNSPDIALDITRGDTGVEVILIGGALRHRTRSTAGPMAVASLRTINVEIAFLGASAINRDGLSSFNLSEGETKAAAVDAAERVIVLADGSKLGKRGLVQVCPLDRLDMLISDPGADESNLLDLADAGLKIATA
ncbi:DeoR/GlpR family transcriptional regulator of sugar metabolism [Marmoricola sp. URHA0025 HA25]